MKVIAFYLPQFHRITENDTWWGPGFTEWTNVKKAKPLFAGHYQPRVPSGKNYYDLTDIRVIRKQCQLARQFGIYGFCFYHYWFDGKMLLEKPVEKYLADKECDLPFCISWANENWTNVWDAKKGDTKILISQNYGNKHMWTAHFMYLLPFLKDGRYIKVDHKPLVIIYKPHEIPCLGSMLRHWKALALENGLDGIAFAYQHLDYDELYGKKDRYFDYAIEYQPGYGYRDMENPVKRRMKNAKHRMDVWLTKHGKQVLNLHHAIKQEKPSLVNYHSVWEAILNKKVISGKYIPGAFVDWDNSPRRGTAGTVYTGATPASFQGYFERMVAKAREEYKKDLLFLFAWNEWAEGGYLEPDEKYGYRYLEAIRDSLISQGEFPW